MHVEACIILSAEHLLNKMRTLAHLILAFAIWLAVHMETAIEAFGVPPNITMAVGGEVGEVIHMHVHLAMCIWQRAHTSRTVVLAKTKNHRGSCPMHIC